MQQITEKDLSKIAKKISNKVKKGDYIFLEGELGVGKTTFAKYFINHFNQKFKKSSYKGNRIKIKIGIIFKNILRE